MFACLTQDKELPVKVEAAVALQHLIHEHTVAESFIKPYIKPIIQVGVVRGGVSFEVGVACVGDA